jgi:hypothetical protein
MNNSDVALEKEVLFLKKSKSTKIHKTIRTGTGSPPPGRFRSQNTCSGVLEGGRENPVASSLLQIRRESGLTEKCWARAPTVSSRAVPTAAEDRRRPTPPRWSSPASGRRRGDAEEVGHRAPPRVPAPRHCRARGGWTRGAGCDEDGRSSTARNNSSIRREQGPAGCSRPRSRQGSSTTKRAGGHPRAIPPPPLLTSMDCGRAGRGRGERAGGARPPSLVG